MSLHAVILHRANCGCWVNQANLAVWQFCPAGWALLMATLSICLTKQAVPQEWRAEQAALARHLMDARAEVDVSSNDSLETIIREG